MLTKARKHGLIRGVVPHLVHGGLTHLQCADDTVILVEGDRESIKNIKFLLYYFEWMSDMKINYHKSEVVTFGYELQEQQTIANWLNCKVGKMPMQYLGFPIHNKALYSDAFKSILDKMRKKLQTMEG